jgi:ABC-type branched-subunit amino acid transport system ATPase component
MNSVLGKAQASAPSSSQSHSFSVHAAYKNFGGVAALNNVSLEIRPGEIHGLIGPNGSGKTTMLNVLTGYYPIDKGAIVLDSKDVTTSNVQARALSGVGRTFQAPRVSKSLTVVENVTIGAWRSNPGMFVTMFGLPQARAQEKASRNHAFELLAGLGLSHAANEKAELLEHGELRFLEIARALAANPRYLLLDEPAGGLSSNEIASLEIVLRALKSCGIGILLVEHHTDLVFRISDRVTAIDFGRVITTGTPESVRTNSDVIRVYLGA